MKLSEENKNKADIIYNNIKGLIIDEDPSGSEQALNYVSDIISLLNKDIGIYVMDKLKDGVKTPVSEEIKEIKEMEVYSDGGTVKLTTNIGDYYIDNRLGSETKYKLYDNYPDRGNLIKDDEKIKNELYNVLENYHHNFYSPTTICCIRKSLR